MARLEVEIIGDSRSLEKAFARSSRSANNFNRDLSQSATRTRRGFSGLTRTLGLVTGGLGVYGVAGAAKSAFDEMTNAQRVAAQTTAALKSTGSAANVSAKQVDTLATAMLKKTGIDDEATKTAENMLLTFTNVRNETGKGNKIFDQATQAVADMATRMNGGAIPSAEKMQQVALQLGKALNDPVKGVTALRRVGVQFTADQTKLIKKLVESGRTLEAQKIILGEVRREFGGSAAAAGSTFAGKITILRETLRNLGAEILTKLLPSITRIVDSMTKWLSSSKNQKTILDTVNATVKAVTGTLRVLKTMFDVLSKVVGGNTNAIKVLIAAYAAWKITSLIGNVAALASKFALLAGNTKGATAATRGLSGSMLGKAGLVAAAGVAAYELTKLTLKVTGLDDKLKGLGASAYDAAAKIGLVHDAGAQFRGKTILSPQASAFLRQQAARLEQAGLTPQQAAARIAASHPGVASRDIGVLAGVYGQRAIVVENHVHLDGREVARSVNRHDARAHRRTANQTSGHRG